MFTFYFKNYPSDLEDSLVVEVDRDGDIVRADVLVQMFDCFFDCTEKIKKSDYWSNKIRNEFNSLDRDDVA